jgi:hypothetical protein
MIKGVKKSTEKLRRKDCSWRRLTEWRDYCGELGLREGSDKIRKG